jgi:hypothetical protein
MTIRPLLVVSCEFGENEIVVGINHFLNTPVPVNFGKELHRMNAKCSGDIANLIQINPQGTVFDFGNGAAGSVIPARELQLVGKHVLRPTSLVTLSADQPPYEIALYHFPTSHFTRLRRLTVNE